MLYFDWNESKARANFRKHGVLFSEARSVFFDQNAVQFFDDEHSEIEDRFILLGLSNRFRVLIVVHAEQEEGAVVRIISARKATSKETGFYLRGAR
jgi:uncharacterized DUF497 family protein